MTADPDKPLLRLDVERPRQRSKGKGGFPQKPESFPRDRQIRLFDRKFDRLQQSLARDTPDYELRADPTALAPECLLVFEVRGTIQNFANAVRKIEGMEYVGEDDLPEDDDKAPIAYLMVPDMRALQEIESLWRRWERGDDPGHEQAAWRDVFNLLRDIRRWGPQDRVEDSDGDILQEMTEGQPDSALIRLEVELVYRSAEDMAIEAETEVAERIRQDGGTVIARSRLEDIAWHALLVDLPVSAMHGIIARAQDSIAGLEPVMHIRPQSLASGLDIADPAPVADVAREAISGRPILALFDGVPISEHPLLENRLTVLDHFGLEPETEVARREHGTAMASLIVRGAQFLSLDRRRKAALLKALVAHPAAWPSDTAGRIKDVVGPEDNRKHARQRDNIRRFLGYGVVDCDDAVACAADRATFWATGLIGADSTVHIDIPLPEIIGLITRPLMFSATLAWISPVRPGSLSYRNLKLEIAKETSELTLDNVKTQPDQNQSKRGTLITRRWESNRGQPIIDNSWETVSVTRLPDQGEQLDEVAAFGLAVTLAIPGGVQLYDQVREMVHIRQRSRARV